MLSFGGGGGGGEVGLSVSATTRSDLDCNALFSVNTLFMNLPAPGRGELALGVGAALNTGEVGVEGESGLFFLRPAKARLSLFIEPPKELWMF